MEFLLSFYISYNPYISDATSDSDLFHFLCIQSDNSRLTARRSGSLSVCPIHTTIQGLSKEGYSLSFKYDEHDPARSQRLTSGRISLHRHYQQQLDLSFLGGTIGKDSRSDIRGVLGNFLAISTNRFRTFKDVFADVSKKTISFSCAYC